MARESEIHRAYQRVGRLAESYDGMMASSSWIGRAALRCFWCLPGEKYRAFIAQAFAGLPQGFSGKLLEIPVGTGVLSLSVYREMPDAEIICMDYAEAMLERAEERAKSLSLRNVHFRQGDVGNLPFAEGSFDIVLSIDGFHAFPDKERAYRETWRVLRPGGRLCGCMYVRGEMLRTDWFVRLFCQRFGYFTPPFETLASLEARFRGLYRDVRISHVSSFAGFICQK